MNTIRLEKDYYSLEEIETVVEKVVSSKLKEVIDLLSQNKKDSEMDLMTRKEVCKILSVSTVTLHNYKHNGTLIPKKTNGRVYYLKSDIKNYLNGKEAQNV